MPNINISWTPGAGALSQIIQAQNKAATSPVWSPAGFTPVNPLGPTVSSAVFSALGNCIYRFRVRTICINEENPYSDIVEGIAFECPPLALKEILGNDSFSVEAVLGVTSITKVKFLLYNSTGTSLITSSPEIPVSSTTVGYTFSAPTGVEYQLAIILYTELIIDGVPTEIYSSFEEDCKKLINTTSGVNYYVRLEYDDAPAGSCISGATTTTFINKNAYLRVYSDVSGTIPIIPPVGCEITFDVVATHTRCRECESMDTLFDDITSYSLTLNTGSVETLVPEGYKYSSGLDWMNCVKDEGSTGEFPDCSGATDPPPLCALTIEIKKHEIENVISTGVTPVTIIT